MSISREKIHDIVDIYYQPTFKTFYVNSIDGTTLIKPMGVFVSLGITTSVKILDDIRDVLEKAGYSAKLAEISSKKIDGKFINVLENINNPEQYKLTEFDSTIMDEKASREVLSDMKKMLTPESDAEVLKSLVPKISKLQDLIDKLTDSNGWDAHLIQKEGDEFRIFHQFVNYKKIDDVEYRVGIYVSERI